MRYPEGQRKAREGRDPLVSVAGAIVATVLITIWPASRAMAADELCFNSTFPAPTIDGVVTGDDGWIRASQYVFQNGTASPHAVVQTTRVGSDLYLSFEVNNDPRFDLLDTLLITLSPDGSPANDHRILIHPVADNAGNAPTAPGGPPAEVKYWADSSNWNNSPAQPVPGWLQNASGNVRVTSSSNALPLKSWVVEIHIPSSAVTFPATDLGLYFNIIRVAPPGAVEFAWPDSAPSIGGMLPAEIAVATNTPAPGAWGTGRLLDNCPGVRVLSARTNHPMDPNGIDPNSTDNRFRIRVTNTGTQGASGVTATIKSTRFGVSGSYGPLPIPTPHIDFGTVAAGATSPELQTAAWDVLNDPNRATYLTWPNVCSLVELNATGGLIANRSFYWNLHFAPASRFQHVAVVDTNGFDPPEAAGDPQRFQLFLETLQEVLRRDDWDRLCLSLSTPCVFGRDGIEVQESPADRRRAELVQLLSIYYPDCLRQFLKTGTVSIARQIVHTYRETGREIEIEGERLPLLESTNSFGYVLCHEGAVKEWVHELTGPALQTVPGAANRYVLEIPVGEFAEVTTTVEAREVEPREPDRERSRWSLSLHGGVNDPRGDIGELLDRGSSAGLDLEYAFHRTWAVELFVGGDELDGPERLALDLVQYSVNGKAYIDLTNLTRWFILAGIGRYELDPGPTEKGANVGVGVQHNLSPRLALEGTVKYHSVTDADLDFLTYHGGLRIRF